MIRLPVPGGEVQLENARGAAVCIGCKLRGGGLAALTSIDPDGETRGVFTICGNCLILGVAYNISAPEEIRRMAEEELERRREAA